MKKLSSQSSMNNLYKDIAYAATGKVKNQWIFSDQELQEYTKQVIQRCVTEISLIGVSNYESTEIAWATSTSVEMIYKKFGILNE